ncbi:Hypothetical protein SRAE_2000155700 [Strongyloides ratti]|uniref:Uncharacterized protein n=1 Tax=Strongyloides ratti TaxID=34506 RepID=A0A090LAR9_STRRB|nr:Hypothetical protein SRAE_2000155700 [Strongyloides ratti]CEF66891.1 Hypothetical protein SRAE_2000155700 [Strongyloides ratti]
MKSFNFIFTTECIIIIITTLFFIISFKQSNEVAIYNNNNNNLLPWDKDKSTNATSMLKFTYTFNDTCMLVNNDFIIHEKNNNQPIYTLIKKEIQKQKKLNIGKLLLFTLFNSTIFIIIPLIIINNLNIYYKSGKNGKKIIEIAISNYQQFFNVSHFDKDNESLHKEISNNGVVKRIPINLLSNIIYFLQYIIRKKAVPPYIHV